MPTRRVNDQTYQEIAVVAGQPIPVDIGGSNINVTLPGNLEISNDSGNPIPVIGGLSIPAHDHITLGYTGSNLTSVTYRTGGSGGTVVGTLTLAYSGSNLTSVTRS